MLWQFVPYSDLNDEFYLIYNKQNKKPIYFHGEINDRYALYTNKDSSCSLNQKFKIVDDKSGNGCNIVTADNALFVGIPLCYPHETLAKIQQPSNGTDCQTFIIDEISIL